VNCTTPDDTIVAEEADNDEEGWSTDDDPDPDEEDLDGPDTLWEFRTKCPAPVLLFVCRVSYEVASKIYTRCFPSLDAFPTVWFNYQLDILYPNIDSLSKKSECPMEWQSSKMGLSISTPRN